MEIGKRYKYKGGIYTYRGEWNSSSVMEGLYTHGEKYRIVKASDNSLLRDILTNRHVEGIIRKHSMKNPIDMLEESETNDTNKGRVSLEDVLRYSVTARDDQMARLVKEQVNLRNIKAKDVDYNMVYGLRKRSTMKYETFLRWAEVLGMDVNISMLNEGQYVSKDNDGDLLRYVINDDDDKLVRLIKNQVNKQTIKIKELDYNMVYGLQKRNTMKYETFLRWAELLCMRVKVTLV